MANTPLTLNALKSFVSEYVTALAAGSTTIDIESIDIIPFLQKCAQMFTIPQNYRTDKLNALDGEVLPVGAFTEEYFVDPQMPIDYDPTGADTLKPFDPTARKMYYSLLLARKVIATTWRFNEYQPGLMSTSQVESLLTSILGQWTSARDLWKYQIKKQTLGNAINLIDSAIGTGSTTFATSTAYDIGAYVNNGTAYGVVFNAIPATNASGWDTLVENGDIVVLNLSTEVTIPTDEASGTAFITAIKELVEDTSEPFQGGSLSGNMLGVPQGLTLYLKNGIVPTLETETLAGAFHEDRLAIPARVVTLRDFGEGVPENVIGLLCDDRAIKVHENFQRVNEQLNALGDFQNYYFHYRPLARVSANSYIHLLKTVD